MAKVYKRKRPEEQASEAKKVVEDGVAVEEKTTDEPAETEAVVSNEEEQPAGDPAVGGAVPAGTRKPKNLLTVDEIAKMFEVNNQTVREVINRYNLVDYKHPSISTKHRHYRALEVMRAYFDPDSLNPDIEPKKASEQDRFYNAKLKKLEYETKKGDLISVDQARAYINELLAALKLVVESEPDRQEKQKGLEPKQAQWLQTACNELLTVMRQQVKNFSTDWAKKNEDKPISQDEAA